VGHADVVVYTSAAAPDNPELLTARARGVTLYRRAEFLGMLCRDRQVVAVAGTHGKTTTTAMVGAVLEASGLDPTVWVGGVVRGPDSNLRIGEGDVWAVEADEFDRSFLELTPRIAVVTSLETDHLDCYDGLDDIRSAFEQFLGSVTPGGWAVLCGNDDEVAGLKTPEGVDRISYGIGHGTSLCATDLSQEGFGSRFAVSRGTRRLGRVHLRVPGAHNVQNALAAAGTGTALGLPWNEIAGGLEAFQGVRRRFEVVGEERGVTVVSDYAHHPTAVRATLQTARDGWSGRVVAAFQPHLYTRTRDFAEAFGQALCGADRIWVTGIYPAREDAIPGITGSLVAEYARAAGGPAVEYVPDVRDLIPAMADGVRPGDLAVLMGAGDIDEAAHDLCRTLRDSV